MISNKAFLFLRGMSNSVIKNNSFDRCLQQLKMINIGSGRCKAEFQVADEHLNRTGGLHGGFTSCLVETVTFLKGARKGDEIVIDARTIQSGKSFVFLECELRHKRDDSIIARGTHTVYFPAEQKK